MSALLDFDDCIDLLERERGLCHVQGVQLDASSAGALHESLQALRQHEDQDLLEIMQLLVTKPMQVCLSAPPPQLCCGA